MNGILYCFNLIYLYFRVRYRSPVTFKMKLYVTKLTTVPITFFCLKELYLRCCTGLKLNIVIWSTKILKVIGGHSLWVQPWKNIKNFFALKLVSAIFYQLLIFHQMIALLKLWEMFFISSKKLFSFSRYSNFRIFVLPSFFLCQPLC